MDIRLRRNERGWNELWRDEVIVIGCKSRHHNKRWLSDENGNFRDMRYEARGIHDNELVCWAYGLGRLVRILDIMFPNVWPRNLASIIHDIEALNKRSKRELRVMYREAVGAGITNAASPEQFVSELPNYGVALTEAKIRSAQREAQARAEHEAIIERARAMTASRRLPNYGVEVMPDPDGRLPLRIAHRRGAFHVWWRGQYVGCEATHADALKALERWRFAHPLEA